MRRDSRLSRLLHLLLHIARAQRPLTSETLATLLNTNQVVVRRMLAGLREHGHVQSEKGHGGGWSLARPLSEISLLDVHEALGGPAPFAIELSEDHPSCLLERAAHNALRDALGEAEQTLRARLAAVTLADLASHVEAHIPPHGRGAKAKQMRRDTQS